MWAAYQLIHVYVDMIIDNEPILSKYFSPPKELAHLSGNSYIAGIVEAILEGSGYV